MSIFPRRIVQGLIHASPRYLRTSLIRNLVNRLNGLADPNDALAAEWDVVVLRFVSGLTTRARKTWRRRGSLGLRRTIPSFATSRRSVLQHRGLPCALVLPSVVRCLRTGLTLQHVTPFGLGFQTGATHTMPLSERVIALLRNVQLEQLGQTEGWVFPSKKSTLGHIGLSGIEHAFRKLARKLGTLMP